MNGIDALVRQIAACDLEIGAVADEEGVVRLVNLAPIWEEILELAVSRLHQLDHNPYELQSRLSALLDGVSERLTHSGWGALQPHFERHRVAIRDAFSSSVGGAKPRSTTQ